MSDGRKVYAMNDDGDGRGQAVGCALLFGLFCLFLGIFGTLACRACVKAGWRVQAPITRTAQ